MASRASGSRVRTGRSVDLDGLAPAVPPAVGAHDVGQLGLPAVGADAAGRRRQGPVGRPPAPALGLGGLLLGYGHRIPVCLCGSAVARAGTVVQVRSALRAQPPATLVTEGGLG